MIIITHVTVSPLSPAQPGAWCLVSPFAHIVTLRLLWQTHVSVLFHLLVRITHFIRHSLLWRSWHIFQFCGQHLKMGLTLTNLHSLVQGRGSLGFFKSEINHISLSNNCVIFLQFQIFSLKYFVANSDFKLISIQIRTDIWQFMFKTTWITHNIDLANPYKWIVYFKPLIKSVGY